MNPRELIEAIEEIKIKNPSFSYQSACTDIIKLIQDKYPEVEAEPE